MFEETNFKKEQTEKIDTGCTQIIPAVFFNPDPLRIRLNYIGDPISMIIVINRRPKLPWSLLSYVIIKFIYNYGNSLKKKNKEKKAKNFYNPTL